MAALKPYARALRRLAHARVPFALIGTAALALRLPAHMHAYTLSDADIVIPPGIEDIRLAVAALRAQGWTISVWEQPLPDTFSLEHVAGKYYLRARRGPLTLDITHECAIPWPEMAPAITRHGGIPLASMPHILHLKRLKGSPKDLETLAQIAHWTARMKDIRP